MADAADSVTPPEALGAIMDELVSLASERLDYAGFAERVASRGWVPDGSPSILRTDLPAGSGRISLDEVDGAVAEVGLNLMGIAPSTPERDAWLTDMFAAYVAELTRRWGAPAARKRGKMPQVRWDLPNGVATVAKLPQAVSASAYSTSGYAQLLAQGSVS